MKKRIVALALALTMGLSLAACAGGNGTAAKPSAPPAGGSAAPVAEKRTLKVGMECAYAPYNWTQNSADNGAVPITGASDFAYGYDVAMAKHICKELDWNLEIVKMDWDSLPVSVQSGAIDCAIAGQSITEKRMQSVDFTTPYYYASIVALVKADGKYTNAKGVADLDGATATSQINTVWYDTCLPQVPNANILPAQETAPAMLVSIGSGACDLVVTDMPTAMAAVAANDSLKLLDFSAGNDPFKVSEEEINIGISLKKGNTEVTQAINSVLLKMTRDDFSKMMNEAISVQPLSN